VIRAYAFLKGYLSKEATDVISGGLADDKPLSAFDVEALGEGLEVEREHTTDAQVASEIARDHLEEDPEYYEKLEKIEKKAKDISSAGSVAEKAAPIKEIPKREQKSKIPPKTINMKDELRKIYGRNIDKEFSKADAYSAKNKLPMRMGKGYSRDIQVSSDPTFDYYAPYDDRINIVPGDGTIPEDIDPKEARYNAIKPSDKFTEDETLRHEMAHASSMHGVEDMPEWYNKMTVNPATRRWNHNVGGTYPENHPAEVIPPLSALQQHLYKTTKKRIETPEQYDQFMATFDALSPDKQKEYLQALPIEARRLLMYRQAMSEGDDEQKKRYQKWLKSVPDLTKDKTVRRKELYDKKNRLLIPGVVRNIINRGLSKGARDMEKSKKDKKVSKVMGEFKDGELHSGSKDGPVVKDRDQAIAIALSEAGKDKEAKSMSATTPMTAPKQPARCTDLSCPPDAIPGYSKLTEPFKTKRPLKPTKNTIGESTKINDAHSFKSPEVDTSFMDEEKDMPKEKVAAQSAFMSYFLDKIARDENVKLTYHKSAKLPYRQRAEVFAYDADRGEIVGKLKNSDRKGRFVELPGGGIDEGETPLVAVKREAMEEAGITLKNIQKVGTCRWKWSKEHKAAMKEWAQKYAGDDCHIFIATVGSIGEPTSQEGDGWKKYKTISIDKLKNFLKTHRDNGKMVMQDCRLAAIRKLEERMNT
jgi:ADP-ribose pyrophosphatase YjhB (NUDIX family)